MAYTTPKTDWNESYVPSPSDMNRIEGNVEDNRAEINNNAADILLEESARIAADGVLDTAITDAVSVEAAARIAADSLLQPLPTTSTDANLTTYPIGSIVSVVTNDVRPNNNSSSTVRTSTNYFSLTVGTPLVGTWRARGITYSTSGYNVCLFQRVS